MDNGARKVLIPTENRRSFMEVSAEVLERVDPIFYGDANAAAFKALGVNDFNKRPDDIARDVLFSKYREWEYEREVRILQAGNYFDLPTPVQRVIVGHRMQQSVLRALQIICEKQGIPLRRTGIGDEGIDADVIE
jgi:hypothetical protein